LQILSYISQTYNHDHSDVNDQVVKEAVQELYSEYQKIVGENSPVEPTTDGLTVFELKDPERVLLINSERLAKIVHKDQKDIPLSFNKGIQSSEDYQTFTLKRQEFETLFKDLKIDEISRTHSALKEDYLKFFKTATRSIRLLGQNYVQFSAPVKAASNFINQSLFISSKAKLKREKKFMNLEVLAVEDPH